jgi:hypothetical protein
MSKEKLINYGLKEATLLAFIAKNNTPGAIWSMAQEGIDLNASNNNGRTPLHCAVIANQEEVVEALIQAEVRLDIQDKQGFTPLHYAYTNNNQSIIDLLVNAHIESIVKLNTECFTYNNNIPQKNVNNTAIGQGNHKKEKIAQKQDKNTPLIPAEATKEEQSEGGDDNQVLSVCSTSGQVSNVGLEVYDTGVGVVRTNYLTVSNKKSNWPALENFFSTLVSNILVKVLGLYRPGMPLGSSTEKSAYAGLPGQNKQKWGEKSEDIAKII